MKQGWTAAVVVAAAAMSVLIAVWALWPRTAPVAASRPGQAQARQYLDASACKVTALAGAS